jgi:hypothetical protein
MMFDWIPVYTTDIYIQRQFTTTDIQFWVTFLRRDQLNGQFMLTDKFLPGIMALRNLVVVEPKEEIDLDRLFIHL